jgi:voltage-gated potassium channel
MAERVERTLERLTAVVRPYDLFMLGLSVYVLLALAVETFFRLPPTTSAILEYADAGICVIFLADFLLNLVRARDKLAYLKWGWIDLISSIPTIDALRWGRAVRLVRVIRVLRGVRSMKRLAPFILARRGEATLLAAVLLSILMIVFASIAILQLEGDVAGANITTAQDAIWWAYGTITTVGYGDRYPVTTGGRMLAVTLMTTGLALFGTWTAFLASWFVEHKHPERENAPDR